ncbi:MAG: hypothetical protein WCI46_11185 [Verrucomicrobiota bacterium]
MDKAKLSLFYSTRHAHKNFGGAQVRDSWVRPIILLCQTSRAVSCSREDVPPVALSAEPHDKAA